MSSSEPVSPSSTSSQGSLGEQMRSLSISSTPLTAKSEEVKLFTVLFNKSTEKEQDFYIDQFFKNMSDNSLKRYYNSVDPNKRNDKKNATSCVRFFLKGEKQSSCTGIGLMKTYKQGLFETYRKFLDNFKFPLFSSTMSLPQLELLSMLIFSNREPEALSSCNFMVNSVEFDDAFNMKYERGTITYVVKDVNEILNWLQHSIGMINNVTNSNLKLGKITKPANIPRDIEAKKAIKFNKTFFVFDFINQQGKNTIITMVLGETTGKVTDCKFIVYNITEKLEVESYSWDVKIDDMTFHHGCTGGPKVSSGVTGDADDTPAAGGASKRRYSKSTNKTKRAKRARRTKRRNIKKNKSRRKYGKARNTKRKLRRFHH